MSDKGCCTPPTGRPALSAPVETATIEPGSEVFEVAAIPGGRAMVGTARPMIELDGEGALREVRLKPFALMTTTVTNGQFARFAERTGYKTEAERFGWSFVFISDISPEITATQAVPGATWWRRVDGACWRLINGPGSEDKWHPDHPAVHISWQDAKAFAQWAGGRLPSEAEWEHAARGGLGDVPFPWGEREPNDQDYQPCNIWQGRFPEHNTGADSYLATAPAKSFEPNGYGLYNMCGNIWEWTSDPFKVRSLKKSNRQHAAKLKGSKVLKGGSFLCHKSYCFRYRIAARTGTTPDSSTPHQGFRLAFDR